MVCEELALKLIKLIMNNEVLTLKRHVILDITSIIIFINLCVCACVYV